MSINHVANSAGLKPCANGNDGNFAVLQGRPLELPPYLIQGLLKAGLKPCPTDIFFIGQSFRVASKIGLLL